MLKKILILIGFLAIILPTTVFAVNEVTATQNGKTAIVTIANGTNLDSSKIFVKRNGVDVTTVTWTANSDGGIFFTDTPEPPGTYTYIVTINGATKLPQTVTTTATGITAITDPILPPGEPADRKKEDIETLIGRIGNLMLSIAGGVAIIYIIIGAYHYFFAFGSEEQATTAKKTITWAIVGLVVIILSKVLLTTVWNFMATDANPINFFF